MNLNDQSPACYAEHSEVSLARAHRCFAVLSMTKPSRSWMGKIMISDKLDEYA